MHPAHMKDATVTTSVIALAFLAIQVALPATYYLGDGGYDERFAWRMFSSVRMTRCEFALYDASNGGMNLVPLSKSKHVVWINLAKRARLSVVDGLVKDSCLTRSDVRVRLSCSVPQSPIIGICRNRQDVDSNGVPDGYDRMIGCDLGTPEVCFNEDCPTGDVATCYRRLCRNEILTTHENRCEMGVN